MQKTPKYLQHWRFKCGQVTCVDGEPIGFVTWDLRDVDNWRRENGYTWHELNDGMTFN